MTRAEVPSGHVASEKPCKRAKLSGALEKFADLAADALESVWSGNQAALDDAVLAGDQVVWHDSLLPSRDLTGLEQLKGFTQVLRSAFPDLTLRLHRPLHVGEAGWVLGYWSAAGTHSGPLGPSLPPSGATVNWEGSVVLRTETLTSESLRQQQEHTEHAQQQEQEDKGQEQQPAPEQEQEDKGQGQQPAPEQEQQPDGRAAGEPRAVEVWWSWDPIFLFRQLGWHEQKPQGKGQKEEEVTATETADGGSTAAAAEETVPDDLAARTAAAARAAYATEGEAAEAATAAVAAAAAAATRLTETPEALSEAQAANRAVVELYFHTYNTGHYGVLDHIVHPEYKYDGLLDLGGRLGREAMKAMMGGWRDCLPDLAIGHEMVAAVGADKVTFRWVIRGTHSTPGSTLLGVPAGGSRLLVKGVTTLTLKGGRIARKVSHANAAHTLQQLGAVVHPVVPLAPPTPAPAD